MWSTESRRDTIRHSFARAAAIGAFVVAGGVWLGHSVAATGWSAMDAVILVLFAVPDRTRSYRALAVAFALFTVACAVGYFASPHGNVTPDQLTLDGLLGATLLLVTARAIGELPARRPEAT